MVLVPKFKKRETERKGGKKMESLEEKLLKTHLDELKGAGGEE
ncbi:MAG: hypothetical protein QHG98_04400 [Methanothrix sp.]|nr:hypothetical protein [Methanothrix sp.]MCX8206965.1 hypothetical protein [Methanothrix sp.]MDH7596973.1 hypothetical protein [Methanothrix sp.]